MAPVIWRRYLLGGLLVIAGGWLLPGLTGLPPVPIRVACYQLLSLAVVAAILVGVRRHRPELARAWYVLAAARVLYVVGDLTFYTNALVFHHPRFPSLADVFYLGQYPLFMLGLLLMIRRRNPGRDRASLLDALIITIGLGVLSWVFLMITSLRSVLAATVRGAPGSRVPHTNGLDAPG